MTKILLAAGIIAAYLYPAPAEAQRVREKCTRDRCALYVAGKRVGSVSSDDTGRAVIRDFPSNRVVAKVRRDDKSYRVEKPRR